MPSKYFYALTYTAAVAVALVATLPRTLRAEGAKDEVYLFTSFHGNGEDGLRLLVSEDGYHWNQLAEQLLKPSVGPSRLMRDPSMIYGPDGTFHLVWTTGWRGDQGFGYASSRDLVHWSEQRFISVMAHEPSTVNVWAPELFYDAANEQYVICWASTIPGRFPDNLEPHDNNQRMYYTTTRDFNSFAPTKLFLDPGFSIIDCAIAHVDPGYVLVLKDNSRPQRNLRVAFGESAVGPWHDVSPPFTEKFTEGPTALRVGDDWLIYFDVYQRGTYGAVKTRDFKTFVDVTRDVAFPAGHKHGTALKAPRAIVENLVRTARR